MDLRDRFAAHFASALVDAFADPGQVARRAYDLAEAMLSERARRVDAEEGSAIALEPRRGSLPPQAFHPDFHGALLDDPVLEPDPGYDDDLDPAWLEPPYDPSWDLETRWSDEPPAPASPSRSPGPGLARTQPEAAPEVEQKERSA
jgi:hypothetical protein